MTLTTETLRGRGSALVILGLLLVLFRLGPAALYVGLIGSGSDEIERQNSVLQRYRALAEVVPAAEPTAAGSDLLLPEIPESQAIARLQETVKSMAGTAQVQIQNLQVLRSEPLPGALKVGVRVRGTGDMAALGRLLYAVEAARPLLLADNLQVQAHPVPTDGPPAPLDFQLDVTAFKTGTAS